MPSALSHPVPALPDMPVDGPITGAVLAATLARTLPEGAIVAYEGLTSAVETVRLTAGAPRHDWMMTSGGAIGIGTAMALGAAIACPDRKIVCVQADGCGMYTLQALWTMARERAEVLVVICANRRYAILEGEMANLGFNHIGHNARQMMSLSDPAIDWIKARETASGSRRPGRIRAGTRRPPPCRISRHGPFLIEAVL
ncbi:MAG: thiamine pyrophosphate-dependent enzyme [Hyphomicrobium sp.]